MVRAGRVLGVIALLLTAACSNSSSSPSSPSANVPFATSDLAVGTGPAAAAGNTATVQYGGWLYSASAGDSKGAQFDAGSFAFRLGSGQVIPGFDRGVTGMRLGGSRRVVVPPDLGYGNVARTGIPPNSTLVFEIFLTALQQ